MPTTLCHTMPEIMFNLFPVVVGSCSQLLVVERNTLSLPTVFNTQNSNHPNIVAGTDGQVHEKIKCFWCNNYGHYQSNCLQDRSGGQQQSGQKHVTIGFLFMQSAKQFQGKVPSNLVLLDNQSSIDVFCNGALLHNIHQAATPLDIHCNSGSTATNWTCQQNPLTHQHGM